MHADSKLRFGSVMDDERVCSDERRSVDFVYGLVRVGCFGVLLGADEPEGDGLDNNAVQRVRVEHGDGGHGGQRALQFMLVARAGRIR